MIIKFEGGDGTVAGIKINDELKEDSPIKFTADILTSKFLPASMFAKV